MDDLRDTKRSRNVWSLRYDVIIVQPSATACVHEVETARLRNFISGDHAQEVVTIHEVATTLQPIRIDAGHAEGFHTEAMDDLVAYLLNIQILGPVAPLTGQYSRGGLN